MRTRVPSLASLSVLRFRHCHGIGRRHGLDPRCCGYGMGWLVAVALNPPLAWELPYALGGAVKSKKKKEIHYGVGLHRSICQKPGICDLSGSQWGQATKYIGSAPQSTA